VPALGVALVAAALVLLTTLLWAAVIAWDAFIGAARTWDWSHAWIPALTIPAVAIGAALAWRAQRWAPFLLGVAVTLLPLAAVPFLSWDNSPREQVSAAMSGLPYEYRFLSDRDANGYVVFRAYDVASRATLDVAFAGLREGGRCAPSPALSGEHDPRPKPFAASGPEPIICFESDTNRGPRGARALARHEMTRMIANSLCEEAVGGWAFECFD
jgi:hypothetical protein